MASGLPTLTTGVAFTIALFTPGLAPAAPDEPTALVVHVDNYARVPATFLAKAQAEATRIYSTAGVQTIWLDGEELPVTAELTEVMSRPGARHVRVLLLCPEMSERKAILDQVPPNVLGQAAYGTGRAYIFMGRVMDEGNRRRRDPALVLGRVLAHELGHLVLPVGHSKTGIMRAHLNLSPGDGGAFTPVERHVIRVALYAQR